MPLSVDDLTARLLRHVAAVRRNLGEPAQDVRPGDRFADLLDSMGMVEFLALVGRDCGLTPAAVEEAVGHRFGTVAEVAECLAGAGLTTGPADFVAPAPESLAAPACWLGATAVRLPERVQPAAELDAALGRPAGWLERHAGIRQRRVWGDEDPLTAAAAAGRDALDQAGVLPEEVGALLVASEAPPRLLGLAAELHARLGLRPETAALEVGGACTGSLAAVWLLQGQLPRLGVGVVVALEAPSRFLRVQPGPAGEAAALFGDGVAAAVLGADAPGPESSPVGPVWLGTDGSAAGLVRVEGTAPDPLEVRLEGRALAGRAVHVMAEQVRELAGRHGLAVGDLEGVLAHGGNGRMPALVARELGLPAERVWSATPDLGNLGSASLPVVWALRASRPAGPVAWTAAGAGLTWAAALVGHPVRAAAPGGRP